jgi:hypothetical protein
VSKVDTYADILVSLSSHDDDRRARRELFATMLRCFHGYGMRVVGTFKSDALLIQRAAWPYGDIFSLCDNGGELNVDRVNSKEIGRSAAYTNKWGLIDGATLAYRVRCILDADEIDFTRDASDMVPILLEMAAA